MTFFPLILWSMLRAAELGAGRINRAVFGGALFSAGIFSGLSVRKLVFQSVLLAASVRARRLVRASTGQGSWPRSGICRCWSQPPPAYLLFALVVTIAGTVRRSRPASCRQSCLEFFHAERQGTIWRCFASCIFLALGAGLHHAGTARLGARCAGMCCSPSSNAARNGCPPSCAGVFLSFAGHLVLITTPNSLCHAVAGQLRRNVDHDRHRLLYFLVESDRITGASLAFN